MTSADPVWSAPGDIAGRGMAPGCVDIWRARTDLAADRISVLFNLLSADEQSRAERFLYPVHRGRYIAARGILRQILGAYLGIGPQKIRFSTCSHGKPRLENPLHRCGLRFNLSHSHGIAMYAVAENRDVGIDVEYLGRPCRELQIARRFFAPEEAEAIASLSEKNRRKAFFVCWTRKEALLKAKGVGLSIPLDRFAVSVRPEDPPALLHTAWNEKDRLQWRLFTVDPGPDYVASLAVEKGTSQLRFFDADAEGISP
ncbi:MAG: 4'-phosphopantetheinyl transferase family protein [Thermodesulfobacteriota bacterium]